MIGANCGTDAHDAVPTRKIMLQSWELGLTTRPVGTGPSQQRHQPDLEVLARLRNADPSGQLNVTWFDRRNETGANTRSTGTSRLTLAR